MAMVLAVGLGVPAGVVSAWFAGSWVDSLLQMEAALDYRGAGIQGPQASGGG